MRRSGRYFGIRSRGKTVRVKLPEAPPRFGETLHVKPGTFEEVRGLRRRVIPFADGTLCSSGGEPSIDTFLVIEVLTWKRSYCVVFLNNIQANRALLVPRCRRIRGKASEVIGFSCSHPVGEGGDRKCQINLLQAEYFRSYPLQRN
jgi:hypothetical protein